MSERPSPPIILRPAERADTRRLLEWLDDPEVARWLLAPEYWRGVAEAYPDAPAEEPCPHAVYAIDVPGHGCIGIGITVEAHGLGPEPELGIVIGRPDLWGRGIGTAAVRRMLALAREQGWPAVRLTTLAENVRAIGCYQRCGFELAAGERHRRGADVVETVQMRVDLTEGAR